MDPSRFKEVSQGESVRLAGLLSRDLGWVASPPLNAV